MPTINAISLTDAAHLLGINSHDLFRALRKAGALGQGSYDYNLPTKALRAAGYFTTALVIYQRGPVTIHHEKPMVTASGINYIRDLLQLPRKNNTQIKNTEKTAEKNNYSRAKETITTLRAMVN